MRSSHHALLREVNGGQCPPYDSSAVSQGIHSLVMVAGVP